MIVEIGIVGILSWWAVWILTMIIKLYKNKIWLCGIGDTILEIIVLISPYVIAIILYLTGDKVEVYSSFVLLETISCLALTIFVEDRVSTYYYMKNNSRRRLR